MSCCKKSRAFKLTATPRRYVVSLCLVLSMLTACGSQPASPFVQRINEQTGESFTHAIEPARLAADRPGLSRVGKDYLYVAPVTVSGFDAPRNYLWFAFGSSIDRRISGAPIPDVNAIVLVLDGMLMTFDLVPWSDIAVAEPFTLDVEHYTAFSARVTGSQLRRISRAAAISAYVTDGAHRSPTYVLKEGPYATWAGL